MIKNWFKNIGPGPLVAAAFIGPGTVTVCTLAGVGFGYSLLWAMVLSIIATVVLQEMSARLGIITQKGLSEIIRTEIKNPLLKGFTIIIILLAIVVGNAAYEAGNISGGVLGLETIVGNPVIEIGIFSLNVLSIIIGLIAFILLYLGNYKFLEKVLVGLVIIMSFAFVITAILTKPSIDGILKGIFMPQWSKEGLLTVIALIGTTVVPYNLFLHAALVKEKWQHASDLKHARKDTFIAIVLGGMVSMSIIIASAAFQSQEIKSATDLAISLEPLFGSFSKYFLGIGLFAAGITSTITAPLAAAYVACGCLGWKPKLKSTKFRGVWMFILLTGVIFSSLNIKPIDIIKFAQVANGILLPIIAGLLIWVMNKSNLLGVYTNNIKQNILSLIILGISILLSVATLNKIFHLNIFLVIPKAVDINVDVGEGMDNESQIMPFISSCNIACGGHAGNEEIMRSVVKLAKQYRVKIGAHPSFPDKENFGRVRVEMSCAALFKSIKEQVESLTKILHDEQAQLHHIKPHGALYNLAAIDEKIANVVIEFMKSMVLPVKLYVPFNSVIAKIAVQQNIPIIYEAFGDRNYNDDLTLVSRNDKDALIHDHDKLFEHIFTMISKNQVKTITGKQIDIKAETVCIHGDTKNVATLIKNLESRLRVHDVSIR